MTNIIIESLHVKNVRNFEELNLEFNPKFNIITGHSGCGKTSVLICIAHCFCHGYIEYSRFREDSELWADMSKNGSAYRIGFGAGSFNMNDYRAYPVKEWLAPAQPADGQQRTCINSYQSKDELQYCPLLTGTRRVISYQPLYGFLREKTRSESLDEYYSYSLPFLNGEWQNSQKQWLINHVFIIEQEWAAHEKKNWERFTKYLNVIAPEESNFSYVRTGRNLEPVFSVYGRECYFEELSAGFLSTVSLVIDIFNWIEGTMEGENRLAVNAKGTVLIDDLAAHLDPEWQLIIRKSFIKMFPNIQFIATSHSPDFIASADAGEIIVIPKDGTDQIYNISHHLDNYGAYPKDDIYSEMMNDDDALFNGIDSDPEEDKPYYVNHETESVYSEGTNIENTLKILNEAPKIPENQLDYEENIRRVKNYILDNKYNEAIKILYKSFNYGKDDPLWYYYTGYCEYKCPMEPGYIYDAARYYRTFLEIANEQTVNEEDWYLIEEGRKMLDHLEYLIGERMNVNIIKDTRYTEY